MGVPINEFSLQVDSTADVLRYSGRISAGFGLSLAASGEVSEVNESLADTPEVLNSDPYGAGWMVKIEGGDTSDLMDATEYEKYCADRSH